MSSAHLNAERVSEEAAILEVVENLSRFSHAKDAVNFADQFTEDAAVFNLAPPLTHKGIDVGEKQAWFDSWATPVGIELRDFKVKVSGDLAFCHGYMRLHATKKGPEGTVSFWMRETLCLERSAGRWKIVHEHTSVPFYMDGSFRPAFDLEP